ncbi:MAG: hypothetical protein Q7S12_00195 [bacterium]|nr:hypothetical protein [bacterium]
MTTEEQPQFIKEFSRSESREERDSLAQEIREERRKAFSAENKNSENKKVDSIINATENLRDNVEISNNDKAFQGNINSLLEINSLKSQFDEKSGTNVTFEERLKTPIGGRQGLEDTRKKLSDFYDKERQKWAENPYTQADIQKYFNEENLKSLSVDDYVLFLKRFPGNMITHVTRQGIRDHYSIDNHIAGLGEFQNNFKDILEKKQLNSAIGIELQESSKEKLVSDYLDQFVKDMQEAGYEPDRESAMSRLESKLGYGAIKGSVYNFADRSAIHVATEQVADAIYGGEKGNEIFFVFPSAYAASQMEFGGQLKDNVGGSHNDQRIWADLKKGMSLDAGIVFIPEETEVDAKTGSKYELDENNNPIIIEENLAEIRKLTDSADFQEFAGQSIKILGKSEANQNLEELDGLRKTLAEKFGIKNQSIRDSVLNYRFLHEVKYAAEEKEDYRKIKTDKEISQVLMDKENLYLKAKDTVKSKEYWENYFAQNPEKRPSKSVYYKGSDPTTALNEWRERNGISKRAEDADFDFEENKKTDKEINESPEQSQFMAIAKKIIDERFPVKIKEKRSTSDKDEPPPLD